MVAITVILAAVIGAFVLGFGGGGPSAPSVQWETTNDDYSVTFEHNGGDSVDSPNDVLSITMPNGSEASTNSVTDPMETGNSIIAQEQAASGDWILIWEPQDGDSSQELATHSV